MRQRGGAEGWSRLCAACALLLLLAATATAAAATAPGRPPRDPRDAARPPRPHRAHEACPGETVAFKVNASDRIFEGKVISKSQIDNGMYNVTFKVLSVLHKGEGSDLAGQVRLEFAVGSGGGRKGAPQQTGCGGAGGPVRAHIRPNRRYFVFVHRAAPHVFRPRAEPMLRTKQSLQAIKEALDCGGLRLEVRGDRMEVRVGERLRLQCAVRPAPTPAAAPGAAPGGRFARAGLHFTWYKDGVQVEPRRGRVRIKKRRLMIPDVREEDAGEYECRAERLKCRYASSPTKVKVERIWSSSLCPIDSYCLNGGTCRFYEAIQEMSCVCAEGYKGQRCDLKDVSNAGNEDKDSWP